MTCREVTDSLADLLAGEVPRAHHLQIKRHLLGCRCCAAYRQTYLATVRLEREAFQDPDSADADSLPEDLVATILAARSLAVPLASAP